MREDYQEMLDEMANVGLMRRHRNAMAQMREKKSSEKHMKIAETMKKRKKMVAMKKTPYINAFAENGDY